MGWLLATNCDVVLKFQPAFGNRFVHKLVDCRVREGGRLRTLSILLFHNPHTMYQYVYKEKFISIVTSNICNLQKQKMYEVKTYLPGNINLWIECDYSFFFIAQRRKPSTISVRLDFLECAIYVLYSCQRKRLPLPNDETGTTNFNVLKCIVIANNTVFSPYVRGKNFFPPF